MIINSTLLSKLFNTSKKEVDNYCANYLKENLYFKYLNSKEIEFVAIHIIKKIATDSQIIASKERKKIWFNGWNQSLKSYSKNKNLKNLIPKFYTARKNNIFRLGGRFIKVKNPMFEVKMVKIFTNWYFKKYFYNVDNIYEFGAGTGHNLLELSKIYPEKKLHGSDFVQSSVNLLKLVAKINDISLNCFKFDMTNPNKKKKILKNSAVYTSGALEQLSGNIYKFINYILSSNPKIVLHAEPVADFYDKNQLPDCLANLFQTKRGYTDNLLTHLRNLEKKKKIKIIKLCKSPFGSLMIEGYNLVVWRPLR